MSEELRPCPFCGAMPTKLNSGYTCSTLGCALQENTVSAKEWNTRPIEDALNARIAELERDKKALRGIEENLREHIDIGTLQLSVATARNAELEAFVNRLIEAGNTIVFETFEGYKKHGLFDFAPVNTWQVLVKDWKEREE
mgnify:CR=1 FL=1